MPIDQRIVVSICASQLLKLFPDAPQDFLHCGQTLEQRAEQWILHAIEELEEELACGGDDEPFDDDVFGDE
jgi:hypothetical protein